MRRKIVSVLPALVLVVSLVLVIIPQAEVGAATHNEEFSESDTFIVPETVTKITVQAWGGGGAGGGSTNAGGRRARGGAGGGGGAYASSTLTVEPGQELQVVVGAGGTGVAGDDGNPGSPSFVGPTTDPDDALVRAAGGSGGTGNTAGGSPEGGAGGTVEDSIGQTRIAGGDGGDGATGQLWNTSSGAGGDGAYGGGSGGAALSSGTSDGNPGDVPSGGGGGAWTQRNDGSQAGGAGAAGKVVITWVTYDLTTSSTEGGSVTTPGEDTFTYGEEFVVDLMATPDEGYRFDEWTGDVSTIADVNAAATNITMNGDYSITAEFVRQYDLTTNSTEGGSVTTPSEDTFTYDEGAVVNLVATPGAGYCFGNWTGDAGTIADAEAAATNITMNGDYSITAEFEEIAPVQYDLTISSTEGGWVTEPGEGVFTSDEGTVIDLVATPGNAFYRFANWTGNVSTIADVNDATTTFTMHDNYKITASFEVLSLFPYPWGGCFIATAAYGTPTAEQIDVLREFRDTVLLESTAGSLFVALYYQLSPPVADFISESSFLRTLVRELLADPIVWVVESTGDIWRN